MWIILTLLLACGACSEKQDDSASRDSGEATKAE